MLLAQVSWAKRIWALPVLTALAPSERYYQARKHQSKSLIERAKKMIWQIRRWLLQQALVFVGDSSYTALDFRRLVSTYPNPLPLLAAYGWMRLCTSLRLLILARADCVKGESLANSPAVS